jgi:hypothetical protein
MLNHATHTKCGKVGSTAASFIVLAMGGQWSQRSEQITLPVARVNGYNKPSSLDTAGAKFADGGTTF